VRHSGRPQRAFVIQQVGFKRGYRAAITMSSSPSGCTMSAIAVARWISAFALVSRKAEISALHNAANVAVSEWR
jgi:hypothetical protein